MELRDKVDLQINYICESDADDATAFVDAIELKRVISNLINNSLQAITLEHPRKRLIEAIEQHQIAPKHAVFQQHIAGA